MTTDEARAMARAGVRAAGRIEEEPCEALVWECGPHTNAWGGHDARCRQVRRAEPNKGPAPETSVFLDVDGVLNAVHIKTPPGWGWPDEQVVRVNGFSIRYSPALVARINTLAAMPNVQMHWLTTWEHDARILLSPALGIEGADWPVIGTEQHYSKELADGWWKWHALVDLLDDTKPERVIWIDDDIAYDRAALDWLAERDDVLWIAPDTSHGITPADMARIDAYATPAQPRPLAREGDRAARHEED